MPVTLCAQKVPVEKATNPRPVIKLTVSSSPDHLPMLRLLIAQMTRSVGFPENDVLSMGSAFEHVFRQVIHQGYETGEEGDIDIELHEHPLGLELRIRDHGCPFDPEQVHFTRSCEPQTLNQWVDAFEFRNCGRNGMETRLFKFLKQQEQISLNKRRRNTQRKAPALKSPGPFQVRPMQDEDATAVSQCAWRAYRYEHCFESLYRPERLRALNQQGDLISYVAEDSKQHIFAHCALIPQEGENLGELALAFVDPCYQGQGVIRVLAQRLIEHAHAIEMGGLFVHSVTNHPHSQRAAHALGFKDTCLLMAAVRNDQTEPSHRLSLLHAYLPLKARQAHPCYAPKHHRAIIEDIYQNMGVTPQFAPPKSTTLSISRLDARVDSYGTGHIRVQEAGLDIINRIQEALLYLTRQRCDAIQVALPLSSTLTPDCVQELESRGLIFTGIWPNPEGRDHLMMQLLITEEYPFVDLHIASELGQRLASYIQNLDAFSRSLW